MNAFWKRLLWIACCGAVFGAAFGWAGIFLEHLANMASTPSEMYTRGNLYFWLTLPSIPGEFAAVVVTSSRD